MEVNDATVRRAGPEDVRALGMLADRVFRPDLEPGTGMPVEFPLLFSPENARNLFWIGDPGQPLAMAGAQPNEIVVPGARLPVVSIGAVCTDAAARSRGYASRLMDAITAAYSPSVGVFLISGDRTLYRRMGAAPFGHLVLFTISEDVADHGHWAYQATAPETADVAALHRLYLREPIRYRRTLAEMAAFLRALPAPHYRGHLTDLTLAVALNGGRPAAYAVAGKMPAGMGQSAAHVLEWAGDRTAMVGLFGWMRRTLAVDVVMGFGQPDDWELDSQLRERGIPTLEAKNRGTAVVINPERVVEALQPYLEERFGGRVTVTSDPAGGWQVRFDPTEGGPVPPWAGRHVRSRAELADLFFGADGLDLPLPPTDGLNYV